MAKEKKEKDSKKDSKNNAAKENKKDLKKEKDETKEKKQIDIKKIAAFAVILAIIYVAYLLFTQYAQPSFTAFKSNFQNAPRVAVAVTSYNSSQRAFQISCSTAILEVITHSGRALNTIDFFDLNQTKCTYSTNGFGPNINLTTTDASKCLQIARNEPSIFLNYSNSNSTLITLYHLYVYGNAQYMRSCGIAAELS